MPPDWSSDSIELLRELQDELALIASTRQRALEHRERADTLDRAAAAREAAVEDRLAALLREFAPAVPQPLPPHRPRLEDSYRPDDARRVAAVYGWLRRHPTLSDFQIQERTGVHRDVVARLRAESAETPAESTPEAQKPRGKGSA